MLTPFLWEGLFEGNHRIDLCPFRFVRNEKFIVRRGHRAVDFAFGNSRMAVPDSHAVAGSHRHGNRDGLLRKLHRLSPVSRKLSVTFYANFRSHLDASVGNRARGCAPTAADSWQTQRAKELRLISKKRNRASSGVSPSARRIVEELDRLNVEQNKDPTAHQLDRDESAELHDGARQPVARSGKAARPGAGAKTKTARFARSSSTKSKKRHDPVSRARRKPDRGREPRSHPVLRPSLSLDGNPSDGRARGPAFRYGKRVSGAKEEIQQLLAELKEQEVILGELLQKKRKDARLADEKTAELSSRDERVPPGLRAPHQCLSKLRVVARRRGRRSP